MDFKAVLRSNFVERQPKNLSQIVLIFTDDWGGNGCVEDFRKETRRAI